MSYGKSWLALGLCVATATGGRALGQKPVEGGDALCLALEDNERRLQKRLRKLLQGRGAPTRLHYATEWPRLSEGGADELRTWLIEHPNARLIVIDTLAKIRKPAKGQNVYAEDYEALEKLLPLAAEFGVAILVIHHLRKMAAPDPMDEISGSTGLSGGVDGFLILKRDRGRHDATLYVDGRDVEDPAELALKWDGELAAWILVGDAEEYRMSAERAEVFAALKTRAPEPMRPKAVAEIVGKSSNTVSQTLYQMLRDQQVISPGLGLYTIPKDAKDPKDTKDPKDAKDDASLADAAAPKDPPKDASRIGKGNVANLSDFSDFSGREERVAGVFANLGYYTRSAAALDHYLEEPTSAKRLEYLARAVCVSAGWDPDGWEEHESAVYLEAAKVAAARQRAEGERRGA